jgi:type I thyroxine 5'-deiodinase
VLYEKYKGQVAFYVVYIREAHPSNAWQTASNVRENIVLADPKTLEDRAAVAESCVRRLGIKIPALVDGVGDGVEAAYTGWPDRLYLIGGDGRVKFKSPAGPFGFKPNTLADAIVRELAP